MKQRTPGNTIAGRHFNGRMYYVAQVPGDGGRDWRYTALRSGALPLNTYFARRFGADCRRVGVCSYFYDSCSLQVANRATEPGNPGPTGPANPVEVT